MEIQAVLAGDEREREIEIRAEFRGSAGASGIVSRDREASAERGRGRLKSLHVVALPLVLLLLVVGEVGLELPPGVGEAAELVVGGLEVGAVPARRRGSGFLHPPAQRGPAHRPVPAGRWRTPPPACRRSRRWRPAPHWRRAA